MADKTWTGASDTAWATAGNWSPSGAPSATDNVRIPATAERGIAGSDQSGTALGDFIVEEGFEYGLGDSSTDLKIDPNRFEFYSSGSTASYLDLHTAAITALIKGTASANLGYRGLYLAGSGLTTVSVEGGSVGLASRHGVTATIATVRVVGDLADVWIGEGVTLTTVENYRGESRLRCAATNAKCFGGRLWTEEEGAITTLTVEGGECYSNSTGTITTATLNGGVTDFTQSGLARTVTTLNLNPGATLVYDPNAMTISTFNEAGNPVRLIATPAT